MKLSLSLRGGFPRLRFDLLGGMTSAVAATVPAAERSYVSFAALRVVVHPGGGRIGREAAAHPGGEG